MEKRIINFTCNGKSVQFNCDAKRGGEGFLHHAELVIDDRPVTKEVIGYINRTWEVWQFQSVCIRCCNVAIESRISAMKYDYKRTHGISRLSPKASKEISKMTEADEQIALYEAIKKVLIERRY